jgi:phosphatidylglycerol---prolipoprotein diacylglyceryl transferase
MDILSYLIWSANPEIFPNLEWDFIGNIRWYGLLFAVAFIIGQQIMLYIFKKENKPEKDIETLTIYIVLATIIGARLGHVLFYEPARFFADPLEIFMIQKGGLASHGAAIGILTGIYIYSNYLIRIGFSKPFLVIKKRKREGQGFLWVVDRIVIVVALGGCLIRIGNFVNSEIIGKPTDASIGVLFARDIIERLELDNNVEQVKVFKSSGETGDRNPGGDISSANSGTAAGYPIGIRVDFKKNNYQERQLRSYIETNFKYILTDYEFVAMQVDEPPDAPLRYELNKNPDESFSTTIYTQGIPRHPAQLYEAFTSFVLFVLLLWLWFLFRERLPYGRLLGLFLIILFGLRFVHELFKENQVDFEASLPLNMGQWLSIPMVLAGIYILYQSYNPKNHPVIPR